MRQQVRVIGFYFGTLPLDPALRALDPFDGEVMPNL